MHQISVNLARLVNIFHKILFYGLAFLILGKSFLQNKILSSYSFNHTHNYFYELGRLNHFQKNTIFLINN